MATKWLPGAKTTHLGRRIWLRETQLQLPEIPARYIDRTKFAKDVQAKEWELDVFEGRRYSQNYPPAYEWLVNQADKTWSQPYVNRIRDVAPSPLPAGTSGLDGVFAYGGPTIDSDGTIYAYGGGDNDYGGNEVYRAPIATRTFARIRDPSTVTGGTATTFADGQPRPPHMYGHLVRPPGSAYLYMCSQSSPYGSVNTYLNVWKLHIATGVFSLAGTLPGSFSAPSTDSWSFYSPTTELIYVFSQYGEPWTIDPSDDSMAQITIPDFVEGAGGVHSMVLIDAADAIGYYRPTTGQLSFIQLSNMTAGWVEASITGTFAPTNAPAFSWHDKSSAILSWGQTTNRDRVHKLGCPTTDPDSFADLFAGDWTGSAINAAGGNAITPTTPNATGTYKGGGLVQNVSGLGIDVIIVLNDVDQTPYVYRIGTGALS